jgi:hypothetical protein
VELLDIEIQCYALLVQYIQMLIIFIDILSSGALGFYLLSRWNEMNSFPSFETPQAWYNIMV